MAIPVSDDTLRMVMADQQARPLPELVGREVPLPEVAGKANALIGMRRSGKTYRLFDEMQRRLAEGVERSRMMYLNLEDDRLGQPDLALLDRALEAFYRGDPAARERGAWVFLDEVQVVDGWERFARRLLDTERLRLFVTGSSARQLSTEVATAFRGRSVTTEVLPYQPREAARADQIELPDRWPAGGSARARLDAFMAHHLDVGGFPAVRTMHPYDRFQQLQEYVDLVVLRDVAERHGAANLPALRALVAGLFAANANGFSVSRLHGALVSQGMRVSKGTLLEYLDHLVDAFLVFLVPIRTRSARRRAVNPRKVYAVDPGLARAMHRAGSENRGAQLENAVYLSLRHRYGRLTDSIVSWVKTESGREVDFGVDDPVVGGGPQLVQVCDDPSEPSTRARELGALVEAMGELGVSEGTIVSRTYAEETKTEAGWVHWVPARRWFLAGGGLRGG